jgi:hypothetical protein
MMPSSIRKLIHPPSMHLIPEFLSEEMDWRVYTKPDDVPNVTFILAAGVPSIEQPPLGRSVGDGTMILLVLEARQQSVWVVRPKKAPASVVEPCTSLERAGDLPSCRKR